jgi:hypothetical protein
MMGNANALSIMSTALALAIASRQIAIGVRWVVEGNPLGDSACGFRAAGVALEINVLVLQRPPQPLDEDIVHPATAAIHGDRDAGFGKAPVKAAEVNCEPWSVLKISGLPNLASASSSAATQNETSIVFDSRHARTARDAQSMIATNALRALPLQ